MRISFDKKIWGAAALCACLIASCAKESDVSYTQIEQRSLDAWMKLHRPGLLENKQEGRGFSYYVDVLDAGSTDKADTLICETDCWVEYEFTARDLNGNVWEWQGGIRLVWGELQILANNDAADPDNPQNATSTCWKAINAADGSLVDPESKTTDAAGNIAGGTVKLDYVNSVWTYSTGITSAVDNYRSCAFGSVTCTAAIGDAAKVLLRALALLPDEGAAAADYEGDLMYWNNAQAERCVFRGGAWSGGANAGVFALSGYSRSPSPATLGFRSAYIPEIG